MSSSQHPVALEIEELVGGSTRLLATVMFLPLLDGIFPALVLAGALDSTAGILQVGLLVFGGSATVAVILAEMDGGPREQATTVLLVGVPLLALAAIEAALAPTIESVLEMVIFERFAALVILAVAAQTASARIGELLPRPAVIVGLGLFASLDVGGLQVALVTDPELVARGVAAAGVGVGFALAVALLAPTLRELVHLDRFRFGSAVALGLLPLSLLGYPFGDYAPLAVLGLTTLFALDPNAEPPGDAAVGSASTSEGGTERRSRETPAEVGGTDDHPLAAANPQVPDGGDRSRGWDTVGADDAEDGPGESREPWL
ncbi:DUF5794 domain-containing protein [Natronoarchaeum mannanilyticum]|uniref:DUF5794 domain-containing protein n=3 Tax=Natronoarchaeum mannanilyticum TaxID=926360 RepID=A0AAV3TBB3_9EURY